MKCHHCGAVHHVCPTCNEAGQWVKSKATYRRYTCVNGHRWNERDGQIVTVKRGRPTADSQPNFSTT